MVFTRTTAREWQEKHDSGYEQQTQVLRDGLMVHISAVPCNPYAYEPTRGDERMNREKQGDGNGVEGDIWIGG